MRTFDTDFAAHIAGGMTTLCWCWLIVRTDGVRLGFTDHDVALAFETCAREAGEKGVPLEDHAAHLIVHGLLHLAGHDHEISARDAEAMEALETKALALMGIADPYGDHDAS